MSRSQRQNRQQLHLTALNLAVQFERVPVKSDLKYLLRFEKKSIQVCCFWLFFLRFTQKLILRIYSSEHFFKINEE